MEDEDGRREKRDAVREEKRVGDEDGRREKRDAARDSGIYYLLLLLLLLLFLLSNCSQFKVSKDEFMEMLVHN